MLFFMVEAKLRMANMAETLEKKYQREGVELESNFRLSTTSADQHYSSTHLLQILSKFLHSFRPVDLTAGSAADLPLQPGTKYTEETWKIIPKKLMA